MSDGNASTISLALSCLGGGEGCGCTEVTGRLSGPDGGRIGCGSSLSGVENSSTTARFRDSQCLVQAAVRVEIFQRGGETGVGGGGGTLGFSDGGQYLLPSLVEADVAVQSGAEVVSAHWDGKLAGAVNITSGGVFWFAGGRRAPGGTGWLAPPHV